jgi:hypothetical protein
MRWAFLTAASQSSQDRSLLCFLETIATETAPKSATVKGNLVETAFGKRRLFATVRPLERSAGMRIGDPALMLLKPDAHFDGERLFAPISSVPYDRLGRAKRPPLD